MSKQTRVLIAEDSDAMRATLETLLREDPRITVVGCATDGAQAVEMARSLRPDVITMDVVMPHLDGVEATAEIMTHSPARILIISSYVDKRQVDLSFRAISAGALEVMAKPINTKPDELRAWARRVCDAVVLMAEVPVITRHRRTGQGTGRAIDGIGIVASTGGPLVLAQLLGRLPGDLRVPMFVAQHIAEGFTAGLVRWLSQVSKLQIAIAADGTVPRAGHVYFPPEQRDLELGLDGKLGTPKATDRHTPSGDRLLHSLARYYGTRACGIVLTGMGDDGAAGLLAIRRAAGVTFAQSKDSSIVFGMPQAAVACGATSELRSPEALATEIIQLTEPAPRAK